MGNVEAVRKMQRYIDNHYQEEIVVADLAQASDYSPWYAYRLFEKYTSKSMSEYLRLYRLSRAAIELRDSSIHVVEVALKYGYDSQEGFQRAFKKAFGINPVTYAARPIPIPLFIPYFAEEINLRKETKMTKSIQNVFISLVHKPKRKVILKRGSKGHDDYWSYSTEVGCDLWGILRSMKCLNDEPVCLYLPKNLIKEGTSSYVQGVEEPLDYAGPVPVGFETIELPECDYLMFQGDPFKEEDYKEAILSLLEAIKKYDPKTLGYRYDNLNPRIQLEPIGSRGYIELLPVKKI